MMAVGRIGSRNRRDMRVSKLRFGIAVNGDGRGHPETGPLKTTEKFE